MKTKTKAKKSHVLVLGDDDLAVVAAGLNELPRKFSEPVLQKLQRQLDAEAEVEKADATRAAKSTSASRARSG